MKRCNEQSKIKCTQAMNFHKHHSLENLGIITPVTGNRIVDKSINTLIREIDAL